jgi:hypothetical protein
MKLVLAIVLAMVPTAQAQAAQPQLQLIGSTFGTFHSLDHLHGYYDRTPSEMRIVTLDRPEGRPVALPAGCSGRGVRLPERFVFCETGPSFRIFDTNTGTLTPVDTSPCGDRERLNFGGLGRYWIYGEEENGLEHGEIQYTPVYLNRTTGECRHFAGGPLRDLDKPDLPRARARSCADAGVKHVLKYRRPGWDVVYCHSRRKPLRVCRVSECDPVLGRQTAAFLTLTRSRFTHVKAVRLDSGRRFSWRLAPLVKDRPIDWPYIAVLRDRLYVSLLLKEDPSAPPVRIFSTLVPR